MQRRDWQLLGGLAAGAGVVGVGLALLKRTSPAAGGQVVPPGPTGGGGTTPPPSGGGTPAPSPAPTPQPTPPPASAVLRLTGAVVQTQVGQPITGQIQLQNTGTAAYAGGPVQLQIAIQFTNGWTFNTAANLTLPSIAPGAQVTIPFTAFGGPDARMGGLSGTATLTLPGAGSIQVSVSIPQPAPGQPGANCPPYGDGSTACPYDMTKIIQDANAGVAAARALLCQFYANGTIQGTPPSYCGAPQPAPAPTPAPNPQPTPPPPPNSQCLAQKQALNAQLASINNQINAIRQQLAVQCCSSGSCIPGCGQSLINQWNALASQYSAIARQINSLPC